MPVGDYWDASRGLLGMPPSCPLGCKLYDSSGTWVVPLGSYRTQWAWIPCAWVVGQRPLGWLMGSRGRRLGGLFVCMPQVVPSKYHLSHIVCMPQVVPRRYHLNHIACMPEVVPGKYHLSHIVCGQRPRRCVWGGLLGASWVIACWFSN